MKLYFAWHPTDVDGHYLMIFTQQPHIEDGVMYRGLGQIGMLDRWHAETLFGQKIGIGKCVSVEIRNFTAAIVECRRIRWDAEAKNWVDDVSGFAT